MNKRLNRKSATTKMNRALLTILLAGILILSACSDKKGTAATEGATADIPVPVEVITAGQGQSGGEILLTGVLEPVNQTEVACKEGGIVRAVHVEVGDRVKRGQALASIDQDDYALGVQQAEAAYEGAKVAFETAEKDYQRFTNLNADGSISPSDYDKAVLGYKAAKYGLQQAEAGRNMARNRLANAVVRAPYSGQITARLVALGSYVDPMMHPVLFVMVDNSRLRLSLKIPEVRAPFINPGDSVQVRVPSLERSFTTKIEVMTDSVDPLSHTRTGVAWLDNSGPEAVPSGLFYEARILPDYLKGKIMLPATAVRAEADGKTITYVVLSGKAALRVLTGKFLPDHSEYIVENGVAAGDKVIVESSVVRDGKTVVVPKAARTAEQTGEETK